jgi:hypothetical protein
MEDQTSATPTWEAMEVEEVGQVGEILQAKVISPPVDQDSRFPVETL